MLKEFSILLPLRPLLQPFGGEIASITCSYDPGRHVLCSAIVDIALPDKAGFTRVRVAAGAGYVRTLLRLMYL